MKAKITIFLWAIFICVMGLELYLRLNDPWGMVYFRDMAALGRGNEFDANKDWHLKSGKYKFSGGYVTILADYTRFVPATNSNAACTIVAIGDSFTFGQSVNDDETWLNHLATEFPDVHFINSGVSGYNSPQIRRSLARFPEVDGYIYLVVGNDVTDGKTYNRKLRPNLAELYITAYAKYTVNYFSGFEHNPQWDVFWSDLAAIQATNKTLIFTYEPELSAMIVEHQPTAVWLDWQVERISFIDGHPTAKSHGELAAAMYPYVENLVEQQCKNSE